MIEETENRATTYVCLACIGDTDLRDQLAAESRPCSFCRSGGPSVNVAALAQHVDERLREVLVIGGNSPHFSADSDSTYYRQDGDELDLYIQELLGIDDGPARAVIEALIENDPADPRDGDDPFYSHDQLYERAEHVQLQFTEIWQQFAVTVKHGQRFFGDRTREYLASILGESGSADASELPTMVLKAQDSPPGRIFRARRAASAEDARKFLLAPALELAAPPPSLATPGRMNAAGIAVFYGALSESVAVAEVRPPVGGIVAIAEFEPARDLRLLDLTRLREVGFTGSVFAPDYHDRVARAQFLRGFHSLIAQPIQPHEEALEYLPTQAVAEYVRNVLKFDGIMFGSAQVGAVNDQSAEEEADAEVESANCNVVLFGDSKFLYDNARFVPTIAGIEMQFPISFVGGSERSLWVRQVSYRYDTIDMSDERGEIDEDVHGVSFD